MSRRTEPPPIPPRMRVINGVPHYGSSPWFDCSRCGAVFDTGEFDVCPACAEQCAAIERRWYEDMVRAALEKMSDDDSIH